MLRYKADRRTLLFVALYFVVAITPWVLWNSMNTGQIVFGVLVNCLMSFTCAIIIHNSIHVPIFKRKELNKLFQIVLSFTYGHSTIAYVPGHNLSHHKYTQTNKDAIRTTKARFKINFFNQLFFFFIMSGDILKGEFRFANKMRKTRPEWFWQYVMELALVMSVKFGLLFVNLKCAVLFILIPHQYAAWGIVGTNFFQHDGCDENDAYNHARNFTGKTLNFWLFNNGFHGAHHIKPNLHWSLLPQFHNEKVRPFIHPNLDRESLIPYLVETHIYPAKRVDFRGNPIILPIETQDEDWVEELAVREHLSDIGAA